MLPHHQSHTHPLYLKFQKACRKLQQLLLSGGTVSAKQISSLIKQRNRYAKRLLSLSTYTLKAGVVAGFSVLLAGNAQSQSCNTFINADSANPIHRAGLPQNLVQPTFVDIDGDGDLDCYESNANEDDGGGDKLKITFLRNTGSKKVPYFELSSATGFGNTSSVYVPANAEQDRTKFVDIDGDGDYDCFVGNYNRGIGRALFYKNTGTPAKPKFENTPSENPLANISGSYGLQFSFADFDADGDYDLTVTDLYKTRIYKNTGTKTNATFEYTSQSYKTIFSRVTVYDYDKDGLTDILAGNKETYGGDINYTRYFRNTGTRTFPKFTFSKNGPSFPAGFIGLYTFTDLNNDGFAEAFAIRGNYATTAPVATIKTVTQPNDPDNMMLHAYPDAAGFTYRWRKDGKIIPGETKPTLSFSQAGSYTAEITGSCGTGTSLPYIYAGNSPQQNRTAPAFTKAYSPAAEASPKVYPNPFAQRFTVYLGNDGFTNTFIRISDVQGRIISTVKANSGTMQLGSSLQKGIYVVQVMKNNEVAFTQKIMKE